PKASGHIFTITDLRPEHSGNYYCEAQNTRGRHKSTLNLTVVVPGSLTSAAAGTITVVLLVLVLLAVFLWIRRDELFTQQCERRERPDTGAELNTGPGFDSPSSAAGQQDELHYASVSFSQNQRDVVYSNIRGHQEEEEVQYSTVGPKNSSSASGIKRTHILFVVHHIDRQTAATDVRGQHVLNYLVDVKLST
ncbi:hypothetical protein INR49_018288, partial [Caranx melampygus]